MRADALRKPRSCRAQEFGPKQSQENEQQKNVTYRNSENRDEEQTRVKCWR
jgi:hypothetical protein